MSSEGNTGRNTVAQINTDEKSKQSNAKPVKGTETAAGSQATMVTAEGALTSRFSRTNIEIDFRPVLVKLWQELSSNYRS